MTYSDRYYRAASHYQADVVVRITGDCPLIDAELVDLLISAFHENAADYVSNVGPPTYPDGLDTEVFSYSALEITWQEASQPYEREHVTPYLRESDHFNVINIRHSEDLSDKRWTIDEPDDFDVIKGIFGYFSPRTNFGWLEVM